MFGSRSALAIALGAASFLVGPRAEPRWPAPYAPLRALPARVPDGTKRVYLDAGHGAKGNTGNLSSYCREEQDFTLFAAREMKRRLEAMGFVVKLSREASEPVDYPSRVEEAARWNADVFVSIHSDVRGAARPWSPSPGKECPRSSGHAGFAVLYSDEGPLDGARKSLAESFARELERAGFPAFDGGLYAGLYEADKEQRGVFIDRHAMEQRIYVLRRTTMPAVLLETHNALDPEEADRWEEEATYDAVSSALARALADAP